MNQHLATTLYCLLNEENHFIEMWQKIGMTHIFKLYVKTTVLGS